MIYVFSVWLIQKNLGFGIIFRHSNNVNAIGD